MNYTDFKSNEKVIEAVKFMTEFKKDIHSHWLNKKISFLKKNTDMTYYDVFMIAFIVSLFSFPLLSAFLIINKFSISNLFYKIIITQVHCFICFFAIIFLSENFSDFKYKIKKILHISENSFSLRSFNASKQSIIFKENFQSLTCLLQSQFNQIDIVNELHFLLKEYIIEYELVDINRDYLDFLEYLKVEKFDDALFFLLEFISKDNQKLYLKKDFRWRPDAYKYEQQLIELKSKVDFHHSLSDSINNMQDTPKMVKKTKI